VTEVPGRGAGRLPARPAGDAMVVTVTPNPSLDRTLEVPTLTRGGMLRAHADHLDPGGKGVNVSRALVANGHRSRAVLPLGGFEGEQLASLLQDLGIEVARVPVADAIRSNVTVVESDGTVTKLNAPGPSLIDSEVEALLQLSVVAAAGARWVAACGSLPPGAPDDLYSSLVTAVRGAGALVAVDTSGAALGRVLDSGPDLLKPNEDELAEVVGVVLEKFGDVMAGADKLRSYGVRTVLVSLGSSGAVLVDDAGAIHAESPAVVPRSTVGAGDALLAGFLAAGGEGPEALAEGVAWAAAACGLPGTAMPGPADLHRDEVRIQRVEPERPLRGDDVRKGDGNA
jgi:1-phosphofructokinase